jgi:deoxyuridine 5'-triphosphate nucleotidohydrolase
MIDDTDITYFSSIDTPEKAYILGLILFNVKQQINTSLVREADYLCNLQIEFTLNNVKNEDNKMVSYDFYKENEANKNTIPYYNNIDVLITNLKKLGVVVWNKYNNIELTISSSKIIEDLSKKFKVSSDMIHNEDLSYIIDKFEGTEGTDGTEGADGADEGTDGVDGADDSTKHFIRAYIERFGNIIGNHLYITLYNENNVKKIGELYKVPFTSKKFNNIYTMEYSNANMIDFLGIFYSEYDVTYINKTLYDFINKEHKYNEHTIPTLKVFKADVDAVMPSKTSYSDAGYDLTIIKEYKVLNSDTTLYDTGIKLDIPNGFYVEIVPRSSISRSGYMLANNVGIIDQGYRGNLYVALRKVNKDCEDLVLPWKCCQIIVKKQVYAKLKLTTEAGAKTNRGDGGFGSTDKKAVTTAADTTATTDVLANLP